MKFFGIVLAVAVILSSPAFADTTWVQVGSPYNANSLPFWGLNYDAMRFQILYLQSEINQAGEIAAFGLSTGSNPPAQFYNVRISLCHTSATSLGTDFVANYGGNQPKVVLAADTLLVGITNQWYYFPCAYTYNNVDNLIFEVQWRGDAGSTVTFWRNANGTDPRRAWAYNNDTAAVGQVDLVQAYYARIGFVTTGVEEGGAARVSERLLDVRPSVGRREFTIRCAGGARAGIQVLDAMGRLVERLPAAAVGTGFEATWHAAGIPPGVYLVRAEVAGQVLHRPIVVAR